MHCGECGMWVYDCPDSRVSEVEVLVAEKKVVADELEADAELDRAKELACLAVSGDEHLLG